MIEKLNDTILFSVSPLTSNMISVTTMLPLSNHTAPEPAGNKNDEKKEIEMKLPFEKWILPPQPEGYIQFLYNDPF
ncbi:MAG: hypothetical protein JST10_06625 [Bacteroidetes bacterium]|nr:hypothetical protein [Bacteroidota bacterium]